MRHIFERQLGVALVTLCSLPVGVVHITLARPHWETDWRYGIFFVVVGVVQIASAAVLAVPRLQRARSVVMVTLASSGFVNAIAVAVWILTRTLGPPFGADAGLPEEIGLIDVAVTTLEIIALAASLSPLPHVLKGVPLPPVPGRWSAVVVIMSVVASTVCVMSSAEPSSGLCSHAAAQSRNTLLIPRYGHSILAPPGAPTPITAGSADSVLAGELINCSRFDVTIDNVTIIGTTGNAARVDGFRIGRLDGRDVVPGQRVISLSQARLPPTGSSPTFGLYATLQGLRPGTFSLNSVAITATDGRRQVEHRLATVVWVAVR